LEWRKQRAGYSPGHQQPAQRIAPTELIGGVVSLRGSVPLDRVFGRARPKHERDDEQHEGHEEHDLGREERGARDLGEPEQCGDQCDNQEQKRQRNM